jgi:AcrR family transcriptional regulator
MARRKTAKPKGAPRTASARVQRKRQDRRDEILRLAREEVLTQGIRFSMRSLADRLDLKPAALYWYFGSRDALVAELESIAIATMGDAMQLQVVEWMTGPAARFRSPAKQVLFVLLAMADWYVDYMAENVDIATIIHAALSPGQPLEDADGRKPVAAMRGALSKLAIVVEQAQATGAVSPGDALQRATIGWASINALAQLTKQARIDAALLPIRHLARGATLALLRGWGAKPRHLADVLRAVENMHQPPPA